MLSLTLVTSKLINLSHTASPKWNEISTISVLYKFTGYWFPVHFSELVMDNCISFIESNCGNVFCTVAHVQLCCSRRSINSFNVPKFVSNIQPGFLGTFQGQFLIFQGLKITEVGSAMFGWIHVCHHTKHNYVGAGEKQHTLQKLHEAGHPT